LIGCINAVLPQAIDVCRRAGRVLLDAVLPPLCLGCAEIVSEPGALCASCWSGLAFLGRPHCETCGYPFPAEHHAVAVGLCGPCLARPPRYRQARAVLAYDTPSRALVLPFKHGDRTDMAGTYTRWMARAGSELLERADFVAPVPLHWRRLLLRRYNQAALLAAGVAREAGRPHRPDLLLRSRWTGSQAGLAGKERRRNVRNAFLVNARHADGLKGKNVLLVDDVMTTGATVEACTLALRRAGASHVDVLTLARVVRPSI
jgi:ComF family protein